MTQKLPQICTVILRIRIGKVAWFAVCICGILWVAQYVPTYIADDTIYTVNFGSNSIVETACYTFRHAEMYQSKYEENLCMNACLHECLNTMQDLSPRWIWLKSDIFCLQADILCLQADCGQQINKINDREKVKINSGLICRQRTREESQDWLLESSVESTRRKQQQQQVTIYELDQAYLDIQ